MHSVHLKLDNIWHNYGPLESCNWTLKSVDLELFRGELLGLLGPSGCGKTTLLRLIAGFEQPSKGFITLDNQLISSSSKLLPPERRGVGMVFQDYALFPHLDVWKNVCFGLSRNCDKSRVIWILELLGLADLRYRYPHELSGGQRQRLALARSLAPGPSLVVLDEPFCSLDVQVRLRLRNELASVLKTCSASAILVTHDPQEAVAICDRVAVLRNGEIHQCSTPSELIHRPATPFVGSFVLSRNIVPARYKDGLLLTPIGNINVHEYENCQYTSELMVDERSLQLIDEDLKNAVVIGREYFGNHWIIRIKLDNLILRVWHPIDKQIEVGTKCSIGFKTGANGTCYPGANNLTFA